MAGCEPDPELLYTMEAATFSFIHVNKESKVCLKLSTFDTGNTLFFSDIGFIYLGKKGKYLKHCKYISEYDKKRQI